MKYFYARLFHALHTAHTLLLHGIALLRSSFNLFLIPLLALVLFSFSFKNSIIFNNPDKILLVKHLLFLSSLYRELRFYRFYRVIISRLTISLKRNRVRHGVSLIGSPIAYFRIIPNLIPPVMWEKLVV